MSRDEGEYACGDEMAPEVWNEHWKKAKTDEDLGFHLPRPHKAMEKYLDKCLHGLSKATIFFPMCGKDVTMKWLADAGHVVVGVECSPDACQQFFTDHKLKYTTSSNDVFTVYQSSECNVTLFCGDFYKFNPTIAGCSFDVMFDRGAINSLTIKFTQKYAETLLPLMAPGCVTLMLYFIPNPDKPPDECFFVINQKLVKELFGAFCRIDSLEIVDGKVFNEDLKDDEDTENFLEEYLLLTKN